MTEPSKGLPRPGKTSFDSMTHQQMLAILSDAQMTSVSNISAQLYNAAATINEIATAMKNHVANVEWKGQGADAFREWGNQTANATLSLGDYADNAAKWLDNVAVAILHAQSSMPKESETTNAQALLRSSNEDIAASHTRAYHNDPDMVHLAATARTNAAHAQNQITITHAEAARVMEALGQSYVQSGEQINKAQPPTFPPPAGYLGDEWRQPVVAHAPLTEAVTPVRGDEDGSGDGKLRTSGGSSVPSERLSLPSSGSHVSTPPVHLHIDSASAPPAPPVAPPPVAHQPPAATVGPTLPPVGFVPPGFGGGGRGFVGPAVTKEFGGSARSYARGTELPEEGFPGGRQESGIMGGRAVQSTGRPLGRIPRGTVIGAEEGTTGGANGRPMMGRSMASGMGMHGGSGAGRNGLVGGRRLASESGGEVARVPEQGEKASARPFTSGGSGLAARERSGSLRGNRWTRRRRKDRNGERPDYLVEDEETWQSGEHQIVPPVID